MSYRGTARLMNLAAALFLLAACNKRVPPPPPYTQPAVGTTYHYKGGFNTVTGNDGYRTGFVDSLGRKGVRVGLFMTDNPEQMMKFDAKAVASFWPLATGKEVTVLTTRGEEEWTWDLSVTGQQELTVPAGTFETYLVQGVEAPHLVRNPKTAYTAAYKWWYAPSINAVVKFQTTYLTGPVQGRIAASELISIDSSKAIPATTPPATIPRSRAPKTTTSGQ